MSAREAILSAVRAAKPAPFTMPDVASVVHTFPRSDWPLTDKMERVARAASANVVRTTRANLSSLVREVYPNAKRVLSHVKDLPGNSVFNNDPHLLADVDVFACEGALGVAENGSVWLVAPQLGQRAALFLAANVVLVLESANIVENMHDAYAKIDIAACEFGVFVAGPSKTADIEQSLVVGAHGPKSLTLVLLTD